MGSQQSGLDLPFEEAFARLEEVVQRLEEGVLPLQEALSLYEQGVALARHCQALLDQAELRVTRLVEEEGEVHEAPFAEADEGELGAGRERV